MPREVIGYEGEGRARRPLYRDEMIDTSPMAGLPPGSPEAAAAIDRVAGVKAAETYGRTVYPKESVLKGARRHQEVMAERRAAIPPEEAATATPLPAILPEILEDADPIDALIAAAEAVKAAQREELAARTRLREAEEITRLATAALEAAWRAARVGPVVVDSPVASFNAPPEPKNRPGAKAGATTTAVKRQPGRHPGKAQEAEEKAERARRVMEAMARHGGDQRAVAAELGMALKGVKAIIRSLERQAAQA